MGIDMGQYLARHVASPARDLVLEYGRNRRVHWLVTAFLPKAIEHVISRPAERSTRTPESLEVVGGVSSVDLVLLPEVPAQFGGVV